MSPPSIRTLQNEISKLNDEIQSQNIDLDIQGSELSDYRTHSNAAIILQMNLDKGLGGLKQIEN